MEIFTPIECLGKNIIAIFMLTTSAMAVDTLRDHGNENSMPSKKCALQSTTFQKETIHKCTT